MTTKTLEKQQAVLNEINKEDASFSSSIPLGGVDMFKREYVTNAQGQQVTRYVANSNVLTPSQVADVVGSMTVANNSVIVATTDLQTYGLTRNDARGMAGMKAGYVQWSDMEDAEIQTDFEVPSSLGVMDAKTSTIDLPFIVKKFKITSLASAMSNLTGINMLQEYSQASVRKISQKLEQVIFGFDGSPVYGLTNFPSRTQVTFTGSGWASSSGVNILKDVTNMIQAMKDAGYYGKAILYMDSSLWEFLEADYNANIEKSIFDKILAKAEIEAIRPTPYITGNKVCLLPLDPQFVELIVSQKMTFREYPPTQDGIPVTVFAKINPLLKKLYDNKSAIIHGGA